MEKSIIDHINQEANRKFPTRRFKMGDSPASTAMYFVIFAAVLAAVFYAVVYFAKIKYFLDPSSTADKVVLDKKKVIIGTVASAVVGGSLSLVL